MKFRANSLITSA